MKKLTVLVNGALGLGIAASFAAIPAYAQQATEKVEKIEVTGSSVKRIQGESALPITIINKADIQKTGASNTAELLDRVSANAGGAYNVSIGVGDSGQPGFSGVSLRGLGEGSTLILLNGRRLANYAFNGAAVDVNSIPLAVIERVEILKDGASAIYGTDAIGGVINFITRKDFTGVELAAAASQTDQGGADNIKATITGGFGDLAKNGYNLFASWDYDDTTSLPGRLRSFAKTGIRPDLGFSKTSGNVVPANIRGAGITGTVNPSAATGCRPDLGSIQNDNGTGTPDRTSNFCRYDYTSALDIFPPVNRRSFVTRGTMQLNPQNQLSAEYILVKNITRFASSETPVNDFSGNGPFQYPAGGPFYPTSFKLPDGTVVTPTGPLNLAWRSKEAGLRTNEAHSDTQRVVLSLDGSAGTIDYKAGLSHNENKARDVYVDGWLSEARLRAALATGLVNPFGANNAAGLAELQKAKILEDVRKSKATTDSADAKMTTELMQLSGGALAMAAGVESRKEKLDDQPQAVLFSGDVQGGGGALPPVTADRKVNAIYAELSIPIVKTLEMQLQARHDRYSDFGNSTNPKVALRWNPIKEFLMRGSYNTGFRAPSLPDLFLPTFKGNTANSFDDPVRCPGGTPQAGGGAPLPGGFVDEGLECNAQFINNQGGNRLLTPEKSKQFTLGLVIEPMANVSASFDYFAIKKENTISALGDSTLFENYAKYDAAGKFVRFGRNALGNCTNEDPASGIPLTPAGVPCAIDYVDQVSENLGIVNTRGLDISIQTRFPTSLGLFSVNLDGTRVFKYEYQRERGGAFFNNNGVWTADLGGAIAKWKHSLAFSFKRNYWTATVINNYVAGHVDDGGARDVGSFRTWDAQTSWDGGIKNMQMAFGIRNVLNTAPPASVQGSTFQVGYDPTDTDPHGRTFYGNVRYKF
ncbi:MAG: TonB-dependent receptor [Burkholderiales bacterium]